MSFLDRRKKLKLEELNVIETPTPINKPTSGDCPQIYQHSGICTCMNCPRMGECSLEKISRSLVDKEGRCVRPIRACSIKAMERGDPPVCASLALEEYFDYLEGKYLR